MAELKTDFNAQTGLFSFLFMLTTVFVTFRSRVYHAICSEAGMLARVYCASSFPLITLLFEVL